MTKDEVLDRITQKMCMDAECTFVRVEFDPEKLAELLAEMSQRN